MCRYRKRAESPGEDRRLSQRSSMEKRRQKQRSGLTAFCLRDILFRCLEQEEKMALLLVQKGSE